MVLLLRCQQNSSWYLLDWKQGGAKHESGGKEEKNSYLSMQILRSMDPKLRYITHHKNIYTYSSTEAFT
jgi:hypothetical protein